MRLLLLGSDYHTSIERHYFKYIKDLGVDVALFGVENLYVQYSQKNIFSKIVNRLGFNSDIFQTVNQATIKFVTEYKPTHLLVFKGMHLLPKTIQWFKTQGVILTNYNPDHPFIFSGAGSGNNYVTEALPYYDLHFCYSKLLIKELKEKYSLRTVFLPFGYEFSEQNYEEIKNIAEIHKVCFIGNPDTDRVHFVQALAKQGFEMDIYGSHWRRFLWFPHENLNFLPAQHGIDFWKTLRKYRVQLNRLRKHNVDSHNMRTFEIPVVGGIQLADDTTEHREFFEEGKEIFLFKNFVECTEKINYLLNLSTQSVEILRINARARCLENNYTYKQNAYIIIQALKQLS